MLAAIRHYSHLVLLNVSGALAIAPRARKLTDPRRCAYLLIVPREDDTDEALVAAMAAGDREALGRLYDRYAPLLLAVGHQLLAARREAEDLVHDVLIEAWRHAKEYDPQRGSVRTWLVMRTRCRALDRRRSAAVSRTVALETDQLPQAAGDEDPALASDRAAVRRALASLPEEQRRVIELGYFEGLSSSEIAERLATPIGTVKSRVAAALAKLRGVLAAGGGA